MYLGGLYWNKRLGINKRAHDIRLSEGKACTGCEGGRDMALREMRSELVIEHSLLSCLVRGSRLGLAGVGPVLIQPALCVFGKLGGRPACSRVGVRLANGRLVFLRLLPFAPFGNFRFPNVSVLCPGPSVLLRLFLPRGVYLQDSVLKVCRVIPPALRLSIILFAIVLFVLWAPKFTVRSSASFVVGVIIGEIDARISRFLAFRVLSSFPGGPGGSFVVPVGPLSTLSTTFERGHVDQPISLSPLRRPAVALVVSNVLVVRIFSQFKVSFWNVSIAPVYRNCGRGLVLVSEDAYLTYWQTRAYLVCNHTVSRQH